MPTAVYGEMCVILLPDASLYQSGEKSIHGLLALDIGNHHAQCRRLEVQHARQTPSTITAERCGSGGQPCTRVDPLSAYG
jgi:hypothetical protein|eukprot:scaffold46655_cov506-Isochrysis_galbana.AAC.1